MCAGEIGAWVTEGSPEIWVSSLTTSDARPIQITCADLVDAPEALLIASRVAPTLDTLDKRVTTLFACCSDGVLAFNVAAELCATPENPAPAPFFLSLTPRPTPTFPELSRPKPKALTCCLAASDDGEWLSVGTRPRGCLFVVHLASATVRFRCQI